MARSSLVIDFDALRASKLRREIAEAGKDVRDCFLEGHKAKGESWYPEMIQLLVFSTNRLQRLRST